MQVQGIGGYQAYYQNNKKVQQNNRQQSFGSIELIFGKELGGILQLFPVRFEEGLHKRCLRSPKDGILIIEACRAKGPIGSLSFSSPTLKFHDDDLTIPRQTVCHLGDLRDIMQRIVEIIRCVEKKHN